MKYFYLFIILVHSVGFLSAQVPGDTIKPNEGNRKEQLKEIKERKNEDFKDAPGGAEPVKSALLDTTIFNKYGDLLHDDPVYNKRKPIWKPAVEVIGINAFVWGMDRYAGKFDFSYISPSTWKSNFRSGPEWDKDDFQINFLGHPIQGTLYYNAARTQGFNYWQSLPYAVLGSQTWEWFGENTKPSYNDMIYTPINGAALGEIMYRISSNILDDRTRGAGRAIREIAAGIINPIRGLNRLIQGKTFKVTNKEVYQKEPLNITLFGGLHRLNQQENDVLGKGQSRALFNIQLDYGNPFENRRRKPFDLFRLRTELSLGKGSLGGIINNITGYGLLGGKNYTIGKMSLLAGVLQYYDYWNTRNFELGALGFGGGIFSKLPLSKQVNWYTNVHLGVSPLAGNGTRFAPDTAGLRDYVYTYGAEAKIESTLSLGKYATIAFVYYHFWLNTFEGLKGNNSLGILRPRITVRLVKNLSIGYEHFGYSTNRTLRDYPNQHSIVTEQKIFLQLFLQDPQRKGRYN